MFNDRKAPCGPLNCPISEMALFRLSFHDCLKYKDGTGGCDGCLNWDHMGTPAPSPFKSSKSYCQHDFPRIDKTDNNGLDRLVYYLEKLYTTTDFPPNSPKLQQSLKASGKSRADLWQFATSVALEITIERSNFACRNDYFQRQQVPLLENEGHGFAYGVWKCKIKLEKPFKFQYGRTDCIPSNELQPYITDKEEGHFNPHANADEIVTDVRNKLGMSAKDLIALTSIHGMINPVGHGAIGTKYGWLGSGPYLSNMYYKLLANRATYYWVRGFDMKADNTGGGHNLVTVVTGDEHGNPVNMTSMRVSCSDCWNTTQTWAGGPCHWRPCSPGDPDCPNREKVRRSCFGGWENGERTKLPTLVCKNAHFTAEGIQVGGNLSATLAGKKFQGWSNMFTLNYEAGLYKKFQIDDVAFRATGCKGINLQDPDEMWTDGFDVSKTNKVKVSQVNQCPVQSFEDETGKPLHEIVEEFADDHDVWASHFLDAFQRMQSIGYTNLTDGPENSWLGYYKLVEMGADLGKVRSLKTSITQMFILTLNIFETLPFIGSVTSTSQSYENMIKVRNPIVFTRENIDPYVCGHHANHCEYKASEVYALAGASMDANGPSCDNDIECNDPTFGPL